MGLMSMKKITKVEFDNFHSAVKKNYITAIALDDEEYQWIASADEIFQSISDSNNQHKLSKDEIELVKQCPEIIIHILVPKELGYLDLQKSFESLYSYMEDDDGNSCIFLSYDSSLSYENITSTMFCCFKR